MICPPMRRFGKRCLCLTFMLVVTLCLLLTHTSLRATSQEPLESPFEAMEMPPQGRVGQVQMERSQLPNNGGLEVKPAGVISSDNCARDFQRIPCQINGKKQAGCMLARNEPYVPFSLVRRQFEIYGNTVMDSSGEGQMLVWDHANAHLTPVTKATGSYHSTGPFMQFNQYKVEQRARVKLITGDEGVPLSTQWDKRGYHYPIQIAQFGLSHYSKMVVSGAGLGEDEGKSKGKKDVIDLLGEDKQWSVPSGSVMDDGRFQTVQSDDDLTPPITLDLSRINPGADGGGRLILIGREWRAGTTVTLRVRWGQLGAVTLRYVCQASNTTPNADPYLHTSPDRRQVTYWMPRCAALSRDAKTGAAVRLIRDLRLDLEKGVTPSAQRRKRSEAVGVPVDATGQWKLNSIDSISISGAGRLSRLHLTTAVQCHREHFLDAADWLLRHQDDRGGWPVPVTRRLRGESKLAPGWYSAMGQGHAMSLLVRAHHYTKQRRYLQAAIRATHLFHQQVNVGGIRTHFLDQPSLPWFEEYPTQPSLFVLNGFIYSLIGLYDLAEVAGNQSTDAAQLLKAGLHSLRTLLPLFDSGTGSLYDLRHFTGVTAGTGTALPVMKSGPNRARWDYHVIHIEQLHLLDQVIDPGFRGWRSTALRWTAYLQGDRSPHN